MGPHSRLKREKSAYKGHGFGGMVPHRTVDVLIIGAGAAAFGCARALRASGRAGSVLVVGREPDAPYDRTLCSKGYLDGAVSREEAALAPSGWWSGQDVALVTGTSVTRLEAAGRVATLSSGETVGFGQALIATGANVRRITVEGAELAAIHHLRTFGTADAIRRDVEDAERVVLVGGSFIATEVAATLTALGKRCTLVMQEEVVLERVVGARAGRFLQGVLERQGVEVNGVDEVVRFEGRDGRVERVVTRSGRRLPADAVVVGAGVVPDAALARSAGLEIGATGGVRTDAALRTSVPHVFAAGDVCEYASALHDGEHVRVEHWDAALAQGATAAAGLLGAPASHAAVPYFFSDLADWMSLEYVGAPRGWDTDIVRGVPGDGPFTVWYLRGDRVVGALTAGHDADLEPARRLIASGMSIAPHRDLLGDPRADLGWLAPAAPEPALVSGDVARQAPVDLGVRKAFTFAAPEVGGDTGGPLWECSMCGFIYVPADGDAEAAVPAGTRFEELADTWSCPVCGASKGDFVLLEG
jgi:3-phenylpropionate/trans-cinnamate dioxygenase ferredoxin reductase subunit